MFKTTLLLGSETKKRKGVREAFNEPSYLLLIFTALFVTSENPC